MSELLFITVLMLWIVAGLMLIAGMALIRKINQTERDLEVLKKSWRKCAEAEAEKNSSGDSVILLPNDFL